MLSYSKIKEIRWVYDFSDKWMIYASERFYFCYEQTQPMKKVLALIVVLAIVLTSCSEYTCPTYAKKPEPAKKSVRV
jgi:hypothetical protein